MEGRDDPAGMRQRPRSPGDAAAPERNRFIPALLALVLLTLCVLPGVEAGTRDDPEIHDPASDVTVAGTIPLPAGAGWADIAKLWYEGRTADDLVMHIEVAEAPEAPMQGEVAAHLVVNGTHHLIGWTTVMPPFAVPPYQGGFHCPTDAEDVVDPAQCRAFAGAKVTEDRFQVPLPRGLLDLQAGDAVDAAYAYSAVWYLDQSVRLDDTAAGRTFVVGGASDDPEAADPSDAPDRAAPATPAAAPPAESGTPTAAEAPLPAAVLAMIAAALITRHRARQRARSAR